MDSETVKKLEFILAGSKITMQERDEIIDLIDSYSQLSLSQRLREVIPEWVSVEDNQKWKHVKIVTDLKVGEVIRIEGWGYKFDGKDLTIEDIQFGNCQSGILVKIKEHENYIDSDWITKIPLTLNSKT